MLRLSSSLLMKGFTRPSNTVGLSRLLALAPFSTEIIGVPARTQSSVPYTFLSAFAIAISYADRYVALLLECDMAISLDKIKGEVTFHLFEIVVDPISRQRSYPWLLHSTGIPFSVD